MVIELTTEMERAYVAARAALNQEQMHGRPPIGEDEKRRAGLAAVLAIVERDYRRPSDMLMYAGGVARGIANRLEAKSGQNWVAMSAGARMVAVRMVELADDADGNGFAP